VRLTTGVPQPGRCAQTLQFCVGSSSNGLVVVDADGCRAAGIKPQLATTVRGRHHELVAPVSDTVTLWRPAGPEELALVEGSGWREWPPRLPGQPIFYPVLNEE
jgi:hypothetical protein